MTSSDRVSLSKAAPNLYKTVATLDEQAAELAARAGIAVGFKNLMLLRASQINGCAFCCRMHARDALTTGETPERINVLPAWRETGYFTDKERASLALIESITRIADGQVPDAVYAAAKAALSDAEIAAIEWLGITINAWNRIAIASRYPVAP